MPKKINAKELAGDIRKGMGNAAIMKKYELTPQTYQGFLKKMIAAGIITREEIQKRAKPKPKMPPPIPARPKPPAKKRENADPFASMKTCTQCGYKALPWEGGCPNCGMSENDVDHIMSYDPISVIFRFFATAVFFGFPVIVVYKFTLGIITGTPWHLWVAIPLVWGVLGIFYYEKITAMTRTMYEKWAEQKVAIFAVFLVIVVGMVAFNHFAFQLGLGNDFEIGEEASKFPWGTGADEPDQALEKYVFAVLVNNDAGEALEYLAAFSKDQICGLYRSYQAEGLLENDPVLTEEDFDLPDEELLFRIMESRTSPDNPQTPQIEDETFEILKTTEISGMVLYIFQIDDYQGNASVMRNGDKWYISMCTI